MPPLPFGNRPAAIERLREEADIPALIRALGHGDPGVQAQAAEALGSLGAAAAPPLAAALASRNRDVRIGAIEALGAIGTPDGVDALITACDDRTGEIRWAATIALGSAGDVRAVPVLVRLLADRNRYVRHGAAGALDQLGWEAASPDEWGRYLTATMNWPALERMGRDAIPALEHALIDPDPDVRRDIVDAIARIGDPRGIPAVTRALRDPAEPVRWAAVKAAPACGIAPLHVPRWYAQRPKERKNPIIAGVLNFLLPGMGYFYLGLWWGILIFQLDVSATLWLFAYEGTDVAYGLLFPVYVLLAVHAWQYARGMPDA
ncbi:MAG: HEAT repeat domain-containing protein [Methanomicrobiales archaeon]|nr:HEAT repeat domain-containing protein [Methanomicrobiales archaeon]